MTLLRVACTALVWSFVLAASVAASADQAVNQPPARPEPAPAQREDAARVIQTLPQALFANAQATDLRLKTAKAHAAWQQQTPSTAAPIVVKKSICGMPMIEVSPDLDAKILLPPDRSAGAAVRRIEPQACAVERER